MKKIFTVEVPKNRNFGLDLLRFIAIFTVLDQVFTFLGFDSLLLYFDV
ncbi:hypothetical protein [Chryseobacterium binzhouense]|nr:hypothetical protein [Chryseobacterium binzhouense]